MPEQLFYLFPDGNDYKIVPMTTFEAKAVWEKGRRWVDIPRHTKAEAEALRLHWLSTRSSNSS
jgi:hypothetical protein